MEVPVKIVILGDRVRGSRFIGDGHRYMAILERLMTFQGLTQYHYTVSPTPGVTIKCSKVFGLRQIVIQTKVGGKGYDIVTRTCLCNCSFTHGYITELPDPIVDVYQGISIQPYNLIACCNKRFYKPYENIFASDFTKYAIDQKVILVPYYEALFDCCSSNFNATGCNPKITEDAIEDFTWRTTLRIVPWCGLKLSKWDQNG